MMSSPIDRLIAPKIQIESLDLDGENTTPNPLKTYKLSGEIKDTQQPKFILGERENIPRGRAKLNSLPLQGIKRIAVDSKIPNIVNIEASPKLSNISDNDDFGEDSQERCPNIGKANMNMGRKFKTDTPGVNVHNKAMFGEIFSNLEDF